MAEKYNYIGRGNQRKIVVFSKEFNIDNGAATTDDDVLANLPFEADIVDVRAVYTVATDSSGAASANFKLGVAAGGDTLVAATALAVDKAIGATTAATIVLSRLPASTTLWVRHTGVAATEAGNYRVQVTLLPKP
jgi:hypothetical protein